mmetsp:Transcript_41254/g.104010  ORF Transcript_41254/g.104010 Transcript_41254/m.104010 type:complete len:200 (+) Transcript_41254:5290-5889(+)
MVPFICALARTDTQYDPFSTVMSSSICCTWSSVSPARMPISSGFTHSWSNEYTRDSQKLTRKRRMIGEMDAQPSSMSNPRVAARRTASSVLSSRTQSLESSRLTSWRMMRQGRALELSDTRTSDKHASVCVCEYKFSCASWMRTSARRCPMTSTATLSSTDTYTCMIGWPSSTSTYEKAGRVSKRERRIMFSGTIVMTI